MLFDQAVLFINCEFVYLEVADGLLQRAVVVQHHASELQRLDVVLVQHEGFLEALHRRLKVTQLSRKRKKRYQERNSRHVVSRAVEQK